MIKNRNPVGWLLKVTVLIAVAGIFFHIGKHSSEWNNYRIVLVPGDQAQTDAPPSTADESKDTIGEPGPKEDLTLSNGELTQRLRESGVETAGVEATPIEGVYELRADDDIVYVSKEGRYMLVGELYDLDEGTSLTERRRRDRRTALLGDIDLTELIEFRPDAPDEDALVLYIAHDPSCPFCKRYGEQVLKRVEAGEVIARYFMFPRAGVEASSADTLESIWCASDPQKALRADLLSQGKPGPQRDDCSADVEGHFQWALKLGAGATPYTVLADGSAFSGALSLEPIIETGELPSSYRP